MKYYITYAKERVEEVDADNFNVASEKAKEGRKNGEVIVSVRSR